MERIIGMVLARGFSGIFELLIFLRKTYGLALMYTCKKPYFIGFKNFPLFIKFSL